MKKLEISIAAGLLIAILASMLQLDFSNMCRKTRDDTLRLHIVANSDSDLDQSVKLKVRDEIIRLADGMFADASDSNDAAAAAQRNLYELSLAACRVLRENGFDYTAAAKLVYMYFDSRTYDGVTLPSGTYRALRIELGQAKGHNWWCVVYPSLCLPGASEPLEEYSESERQVVLSGSKKYVVRWKIEEWFQKLSCEVADKKETASDAHDK